MMARVDTSIWPPTEPVEAWEAMAEDGWPPVELDWEDAAAEMLEDAVEVNGDLG